MAGYHSDDGEGRPRGQAAESYDAPPVFGQVSRPFTPLSSMYSANRGGEREGIHPSQTSLTPNGVRGQWYVSSQSSSQSYHSVHQSIYRSLVFQRASLMQQTSTGLRLHKQTEKGFLTIGR